jgi:hypothetical protein
MTTWTRATMMLIWSVRRKDPRKSGLLRASRTGCTPFLKVPNIKAPMGARMRMPM